MHNIQEQRSGLPQPTAAWLNYGCMRALTLLAHVLFDVNLPSSKTCNRVREEWRERGSQEAEDDVLVAHERERGTVMLEKQLDEVWHPRRGWVVRITGGHRRRCLSRSLGRRRHSRATVYISSDELHPCLGSCVLEACNRRYSQRVSRVSDAARRRDMTGDDALAFGEILIPGFVRALGAVLYAHDTCGLTS
jgi:hypothetical protein